MIFKENVNTPLPAEVLSTPVVGVGLEGGTLGEAIGHGPTLLAFLRHLG